MRADKFLSLDGKEAVLVGDDNKLPALDASLLFNVEKTIKAKSSEILSIIPTELTETDIGRVFIYVGNEVGYEKYATYVIEYSEEVYSITKISASLDLVGLPTTTEDDNNKVLTVVGGSWSKAFPTTELPVVTVADNDKILTVVAGAWATADLPEETIELPVVTVADNDKILTVVNGAWETATAPVSATTANVQSALSIDTSIGSLSKVLSERGTFVDLPEAGTGDGATYTAGDGIDITNDAISIASASATTGQILSKGETGVVWVASPVSATTANVQSALSIDTSTGSLSKVLSEKGTFVDLPDGAGDPVPLSDISPAALGSATAGVSISAARGDHVHPTTGLVLSSEKGAVNGVASLGADGKVPASQLPEMSGSGGLSITRQRFARPYFDNSTHLVIQAGQALDFSDAETIIDTENVEADRAKVIGYTGLVLTPCPDTGFGGNFSGQPVFVDLSVLTTAAILRYKWVSAAGDSDWYATFFPSNGEAYVAPPASSGGGGETPAPTTFGTLKVNIAGAFTGQWSADGGATWRDSGDTITVATGTHTVTFAYVDGYTTPASQSVTISENTLSTVSAEYYEIEEPTETEGTLVVNITGASNGSWSIDSGTTWKSSGQSLLLTAGSYTITFEPILGYSKPDDISATIVAGNITVKSGAYVAQPDSADPTDYGMTWDNGTEPILGEGNKVIYVTPNGAGNFSGDSWANAKAGLYTAGLAAVSGDVLYLQEGTYNHLAPVAATKSIGIYGGFTVAGGTWATRDGFTNPSIIDASSNQSVPFIKPESGVTQTVDGVASTGFTGGVMLANGGTATVKNCAIYDCTGVVSSHAVENCLVRDCTGKTEAATDCVFVNVDVSSAYNSYIVSGGATNCTFTNCSSNSGYIYSYSSYIVGTTATNCTFTNCSSNSSNSSSGSSYIVASATNCTFTNCSSISSNSSGGVSTGYIVVSATNCTFTNCSSNSSGGAHIASNATNCTFTNCSSNSSNSHYNSYIVSGGATSCTFVRCWSVRLRYNQSGNDITNCVIFDSNIAIDFGAGTNNAASAYIDDNTLVLGTDNMVANFASIGTVETIGYSETLNNTPAEDFGDFRPQAGSILIGAGVAVAGITADIDGNLRPDPPTIGAYEYVEEA